MRIWMPITLGLLAGAAHAQLPTWKDQVTPTTGDPADGTPAARRWQALCVPNLAGWMKEAGGSILLMDPGPDCREAFTYGPTDEARVAVIKRRDVARSNEARARYGANLVRPGIGDRPTAVPVGKPIVKPRLLASPSPEDYYPKAARKARQQSRTLLTCTVTRSGGMERCRVAETSGFAALDAAALKLARDQTWRPATKGGAAVDLEVSVPVRWALE